MTITAINILNSNDIRLTFGVPLEDVFPNGNIHPSLHNLFVEIFNSLEIHKIPLKYILRNDSATTDHIFLEETLMRSEPINDMPAGTLIWMLRHFLGMLPIPLLPKYTNNTNYVWLNLSEKCKYTIERFIKDKKTNDSLIDIVAEELLKLPSVNLLLIGYLVNFLRSLTIKRSHRRLVISKSSAMALIKYFSSSLFIRPYHSGYCSKKENLYHPLMLYLIIKWPYIQKACMDKNPGCFMPVTKSPISGHSCSSIVSQVRDSNNSKFGSLMKIDEEEEIRVISYESQIEKNLISDNNVNSVDLIEPESPIKNCSKDSLKNSVVSLAKSEPKTPIKIPSKNALTIENLGKQTSSQKDSNYSKASLKNSIVSLVKSEHKNPISLAKLEPKTPINPKKIPSKNALTNLGSIANLGKQNDSKVSIEAKDCSSIAPTVLCSEINTCCLATLNTYLTNTKSDDISSSFTLESYIDTSIEAISSTDLYLNLPEIDFLRDTSCQTDLSLIKCSNCWNECTQTPNMSPRANISMLSPQTFYDAEEFIIPDAHQEFVGDEKVKSSKSINLKLKESMSYINQIIEKSANSTVQFVKMSGSNIKIFTPSLQKMNARKNEIDIKGSTLEAILGFNDDQDHCDTFIDAPAIKETFILPSNNVEENVDEEMQKFANDLKISATKKSLDSLGCGHELCLQSMCKSVDNLIKSNANYLGGEARKSQSLDSASGLINLGENGTQIAGKINKMGWTYTPITQLNTNGLKSNTVINPEIIGWNISNEINLPSSSNLNNAEFQEFPLVETPLDVKSGKKSVMSFSKLKAKLDLSKLFKDRKILNSASDAQIECKIKYQKMDDAPKFNTF